MAASGRGARAALAWNDWDRKRKLLVILKMLIDGVAPFMLERTIWCRQWLLRREERGAYHTIFKGLAIEDTPIFSDYIRMPHTIFVDLEEKIAPFIVKQETCMRTSIDPSERLHSGT